MKKINKRELLELERKDEKLDIKYESLEIKELFFQNSSFVELKNGREISNYIFENSVRENVFSYIDVLHWYFSFEELIIQIFSIVDKSVKFLHSDTLHQINLDYFEDNIDDFYNVLFLNSAFYSFSYGRKIHVYIVNWIQKHIYEDNEIELFGRLEWYHDLQKLIIEACNIRYC